MEATGQRSKAPDMAGFRALVERSHPALRRLAYRMVGDDMEDVLQESYVSAYRSVAGFRGEAKAETWLYRIVYNTSIDHLRRRDRRVETDPLDTTAPSLLSTRPGLDPASRAADRLDLAEALAALPLTQRAAVMLVDAEGLSFRQASEVLDLPIGTVASRVSRARETLRRFLSDTETPGEMS